MEWLTVTLGLLCLFGSKASGKGNVATKSFWRVRPESVKGIQFGYTLAIKRY